jgi:hypothetical protein
MVKNDVNEDRMHFYQIHRKRMTSTILRIVLENLPIRRY